MSSTGTGGAATIRPQPYYCYQCERTVPITPSPSSDLTCPICNGGFLEEYEDPNPNPNPNPIPFFAIPDPSTGSPSPFSGGFPLLFSRSIELHNPSDLAGIFGPDIRHRSFSSSDPNSFNPFLFLQNYLQTLTAGGANIQFVIENHPNDPSLRLPGNLGDYFMGPGLEQLIQQLAENDPNRFGTPPASNSAIDSLPDIQISEELLASDSAQCAVCKDTFELGSEGKQMPCKHIYHSDCILPWLALHNSCPVCRYELPTDDPDYEQRSQAAPAPAPAPENQTAVAMADSGSGGAGQGVAVSPRSGERRFRISLPFPSWFGSRAEASNSGDGRNNNNNNNEGGMNSGNQGNQESGPEEARQEDLD
ncbi:RING/U-box superfamily protein [Tasmannia lanceolata]|uniref:RING/U-box superfamily protein n=1 Tax=Tasmannia lanceolata TaxID=3420 RepID=UPI0040648B77